MTERHYRTIVAPGSDLVLRWPSAVVVIGGTTASIESAHATISEGGDTAPAPGRLIEQLRLLTDHDVAAAVITPAGIRLIRHGMGRAELLDATGPGIAGPEYDVDATATPIWLGIGEIRGSEPGSLPFDLVEGAVPGSGAWLEAARAPSIPADRQEAFEVVDLGTAPEESRAPLPTPGLERVAAPDTAAPHPGSSHDGADQVLGIECSRGHFNNPVAAYCQVCGISMVHLTHHLVPGTRPTLGYIVFDNGATYALDRPYLIGREPNPEPGSGFDPLVADDIDHTVSREHAELSYDGWDVLIADLGSTNGTFHWDRTNARWERVLPNRPVVIAPGVSVSIGRATFVYETVARSV